MLEVKLEIVSNGVIKTVKDTNYNGGGETREIRNVYETEDDKIKTSYENTMKFFYELGDDLGIDMGNKFDPEVLGFETKWGSHYRPPLDEIKMLIRDLSSQLKHLRQLEKDMIKEEHMKVFMEDSKKIEK